MGGGLKPSSLIEVYDYGGKFIPKIYHFFRFYILKATTVIFGVRVRICDPPTISFIKSLKEIGPLWTDL